MIDEKIIEENKVEEGVAKTSKEQGLEARRFFITQNHPEEYGLATGEDVKKALQGCKFKYACGCYEEGVKNHVPHLHVLLEYEDPRRFSTVHNLFPHANIQEAKASAQIARDYIIKSGKWSGTPDAALNKRETFFEIGSIGDSAKEKRIARNVLIINELKAGKTTLEIVDRFPELMLQMKRIEELEEALKSGDIPDFRRLEVVYVTGATGVGKTRDIMKKHKADDVCRITAYGKDLKFDAYHRQDVLVFEEYHSQIQIGAMLNYLDGYPLNLPARYYDRKAAYTKVYITSNISLEEQYRDVQSESPETWKAFVRRINRVLKYDRNGNITTWVPRCSSDGTLYYDKPDNLEMEVHYE